jgi:hypothetical protein
MPTSTDLKVAQKNGCLGETIVKSFFFSEEALRGALDYLRQSDAHLPPDVLYHYLHKVHERGSPLRFNSDVANDLVALTDWSEDVSKSSFLRQRQSELCHPGYDRPDNRAGEWISTIVGW